MNFNRLIIYVFIFISYHSHINAQCPKLVWSDEFEGTTVDLAKWSYQTGDGCDINLCQWGNNELQWYAPDNIQVSNGTLKITAKQQTIQNRNYTSGRIRTINKADIKYGRIEARMKMPIGKGIWPAFWMLPTDNVYGVWPQSGEIDIMEYLGHEPANVLGTLHFGNPWPNNSNTSKTFTLSQGRFNEDFHTFALEWSENDIKWYVDGYLYSTKTKADLGSLRWPFDQKFHFLLNMAVGGNLPGNPNSSTVFPQTFEVDYVRVYDLVGAPYLQGNQKVAYTAKNTVYSIANFPTGSTVKWTVPQGATIVSGADTKEITVNWGVTGGKVAATVTTSCGESKYEVIVAVEPKFESSIVLENFDKDARITQISATGTFTDNTATPSPNTTNSSALCGKYVRNSGQQYDVIFYSTSDITNAGDFATTEKKFYIDLYSTAPVGTSLILQLENKNLAQPSNYPTGRHSRYTAVTTKQNEWERLVFNFTDRPDANMSNLGIDQLVLLFAPNSFTGHTYYFDNFEIYSKVTTPTQDLSKKPRFKIFPNPVSDVLNIEIDSYPTSIKIIDLTGKTLITHSYTEQNIIPIDIKTLQSGLYSVSIELKNGIIMSQSFVKK